MKKAEGNSDVKQECNTQFEKVEIKEFYGADKKGQPVKEQFKEMLQNSECDSLIISGHHTGYFAGEQSIGNNSDWKLDLDFMEELSCEPGCADWFANVKSVFLMGCRTVKTSETLGKSTPVDKQAITVINKNDTPITAGATHMLLNQAYSSTLAEHNTLNDRYLRMFPQSSLYGWGLTAPGKSNKSHESLPDFIKLVGRLQDQTETTDTTDTDDIFNFINFMNSQHQTCKEYGSVQWTDHWKRHKNAAKWLPTSCFLNSPEQNTSNTAKYQQQGCALTQALNQNNAEKIKAAVNNILMDEGGEGITANFNRLMSLITNKDNKNQPWYDDVVSQLKNSESLKDAIVTGLSSKKMGFVRKADHLYFYREMEWQNASTDTQISGKFLEQIQTAFQTGKGIYNPNSRTEGDKFDVETGHQRSIIRSINDNNLGSWLLEKNADEFNNLKTKLTSDGWPDSILKVEGQ